MSLAWIDWAFILSYFIISFGIAIYFSKRAGKNTTEFFLSGRNMPWWLAGTSMVATTFAADTPLAVTEMVAKNGIAGNWLWWNFAFGGMLTVFFFARLWRRAGILTDVEFIELRYSGPEAAVLRGIKALYYGLVMNCIILGWVSLAMETIIQVLFPGITLFGLKSITFLGITMNAPLAIVGILILMTGFYSLLSGLWGVAATDAFQFFVAMGGTIVLAIYALDIPKIGGISGLLHELPKSTFNFFPTIGNAAQGAGVFVLSAAAFAAYIGVQWWSSWYPSNAPGGGGYIAQRMMGCKDEKHSLLATLWYNIAQYCLRPWPWIIVALVSLVLYPHLAEPRQGFVMVMRDVLPPGMLGLLVAAFLAAFMSTFSTQLNWGTSYIINDFWRRFINQGGSEKYYVLLSRIITFALAIVSLLVTTQLQSIRQAWGLVLTASAGLGLVLILRWYWWRISAWSELAAVLSPILMVILWLMGVKVPGLDDPFPINLFYIVSITTVIWLAFTFLFPQTRQDVLDKFYKRIHPGGPGWKPLNKRFPDIQADTGLVSLFFDWMSGVALIYLVLFGVGYLIFQDYISGVICLLGGAVAAGYLYWDLSHRGFDTIIDQEEDIKMMESSASQG